jgi:hypothetical protein
MSAEEAPAIAPWNRWDRAALQALLGGGIVFAVVMLTANVISFAIEAISGERLLVLPVTEPLPAAADSGTATLIEGHYDSAYAYVSGLSGGTTALLTAGQVIIALSNLLAVGAFLYLVWRLLRREPFKRSLTWSFVAAGASLMFGSIIGQTLIGIGSIQAMGELGGSIDESSFWPVAFTFDGSAVTLGFVLLLVASAFEYAQKLSAETRGLV